MKKYKHFIFDFDGMLIDTYPHMVSAFVEAIKEIRKVNINYKEAFDNFKVSYATAYKFYNVTKEEQDLFKIKRDQIFTPPVPTLYLPVRKLLNDLVNNGYDIYLYTDRHESLYDYLDAYDLNGLFKDIVISANKPDTKPLLDLISRNNLDVNECVMVGDRELDVLTSYKVGMDGILYDNDDRVILHHATYVIKHIQELYNFFDIPYRMKNNYHTHTLRCGHAVGKDEDYIIKAIEAGYQTIGMSDHVMIPNINKNYEYFDDIALLKEKYKEQIKVKIALEVEYYPYYIPFYKKLLAEGSVDYLIFGNHGTIKENEKDKTNQISFIDHFTDISILDMYYDCLVKAIDTGLFKYIAHPDCFLKGYGKWDEHAIKLTHKIAKLLQDKNMLAELSGSGVRSRKKFLYNGEMVPAYPFIEFYKILKEYDIKFVMGADAHAPEQLDDYAVKFVNDMAKKLQLDVVYEIDF